MKYKDEMVAAIANEVALRASYIEDNVKTIYFGGGTPSLLDKKSFDAIWSNLTQHFDLSGLEEVTFEANPDDLSKAYLQMLKQTPVNRLSIGIQSFRAEDLSFMNRAHNATEASNAVATAQDAGFENITIDLIYGTPGLSNIAWEKNLEQAINLGVPHISSYALTVEEKTQLAHLVNKGKVSALESVQMAEQFGIMVQQLTAAGFEHYEISNFAKPQHYAVHNTSYWQGAHYLGLGPGAHSFDGKSRQWNIAHNAKYIKGVQMDALDFEREILSEFDQINEFLLTGLRTMWGVDLLQFVKRFGQKRKAALLEKLKEIAAHHYILNDSALVLKEEGKLFADGIAADLFF